MNAAGTCDVILPRELFATKVGHGILMLELLCQRPGLQQLPYWNLQRPSKTWEALRVPESWLRPHLVRGVRVASVVCFAAMAPPRVSPCQPRVSPCPPQVSPPPPLLDCLSWRTEIVVDIYVLQNKAQVHTMGKMCTLSMRKTRSCPVK